ncbi:hypothetical protein LPC08_06615 [Roseomonas sp. OT10]|uniref:calcium-binding protein n=1 Tax=Roseomonas cutis TaxID=2897332 RepID=UPI001E395DC7|nr:calcium-binding protein [Roseomonas sp. OT10]UFN50292.1 hypothetical protein LPC08_06615 [Roseomonas sp. OT10]
MAITNIGLTGTGVVINTNDTGTLVDFATLPLVLNDPTFLPWLNAGTRATALTRNLGGNDVITGGNGNDTFHGGAGDDQLHGNGGRNLLYGDGGPVFDGSAANFVRNGSFDSYDPTKASGSPADFLRVSAGGLYDWTLTNPADPVAELVSAGHGRGAPSDGPFWLDLASSPGDVTVTQEIGGLTRDGIYVLSFDLAANPYQTESVEVSFGGTVLGTITPASGNLSDAGHHYSFAVTAAATGGTLSFRNVGNGDNVGVSIDNVRMNALADAAAGSGDGNDTLTGGNDADTLVGGGGNDTVHGNDGNNRLYGGAGNDTITGGNGNDRAWGGSGNDLIYVNDGNNFVDAGSGNDTAYGGNGNDTMLGGAGNDLLIANGGNNLFQVGGVAGALSDGNDTMTGGNQADRYFLFLDDRDGNSAGWGNDVITDFRLAEGDRLVAFNPTAGFWDDTGSLNGLVSSDFITASRSADGGDLVLRFNDSDAPSVLTLRYFFWNNYAETVGTTAGAEIGDARLVQMLLNVVEDGTPIATGAAFLTASHDYLLA